VLTVEDSPNDIHKLAMNSKPRLPSSPSEGTLMILTPSFIGETKPTPKQGGPKAQMMN